MWYLPRTYSLKSGSIQSVQFMHGGRATNQAVVGLSPWIPGSISGQSTWDLWWTDLQNVYEILHEIFGCLCINIVPPVLHTHSLTYCRRHTILATETIAK